MATPNAAADVNEQFRERLGDCIALMDAMLAANGDSSAADLAEALKLALTNDFQLRTLIRLVTPAQPQARGR